jgi:NADH-quinone oxidoreductase subunit L
VAEALAALPLGVSLAWLVPVLTCAAFVLVGAFGTRLRNGGGALAVAGVGGALAVSLLVVRDVLTAPAGALPYVVGREWLAVGGIHVDVGVYVDQLTALMLFVVSLVSFLIIVYSLAYMRGDPGIRRYFAEMCLFITGMLGFVLASDFLLAFVFWEIMGLCSYLLIGYWYEKPEAASAAKKAFLVTRVGDVFFFLGLVLLSVSFGTTGMRELFHAAEQFAAGQGPFVGHTDVLLWATLLFFGGSVGKSAQFPLHVWLPDAMEGPTTVSALIHAATMVKAGVYLVARAYPLFALAPLSLEVVAVLGAFTAFFAATMALVAYDIKRVLAYSTISQLSYMFFGLGVGAIGAAGYAGYSAGMLHLSTHAFTKALLFLSAGSVIHAVHTNDMREMGGLRRLMPITSLAMLVGSLSLAGFPGLSIFWSKDAVLESAFHAGSADKLFLLLFALGVLTALLTAFYTFRMWFMTFWGEYRGHGQPHESPRVMTVPLMVLAGFAALWGLLMLVLDFHGFVFFEAPERVTLLQAAANPVSVLSILVGLAGIALAWQMYVKRSPAPESVAGAGLGAALHRVLSERWYVDHAYLWFAERVVAKLAEGVDWFDRNVLDGVVNGMAWAQLRASDAGRRVQSGNVSDYAAAILAGVLVILVVSIYVVNPQGMLHPRIFGALGGA